MLKTLTRLQQSYLKNQFRPLSSTVIVNKKYKYALDVKKQKVGGGKGSVGYQYKKGATLVEGKLLSHFTFGDKNKFEHSSEDSPKQAAYAEIVQSGLEDLLTSNEIAQEIQNCDIEIVKVEVSPSLSSANVVWKLREDVGTTYRKEEVTALLEEHLHHIRLILPAYTTITRTPAVSFTYDKFSEQQRYIDSLFESIKSTEN
ncbi:uncharacterized protein LOC130647660 [Hydractinia symbiolongicarpus]|uniref:uncharacterized protein LOC130647660 n=1 Tax=Hydractinia symbiolongicarpus TaxID=13093 RepID=UPI002551C21D|nr:uncharacterized protein LOC130647660 [Hydractinia symbiolongicarpus]